MARYAGLLLVAALAVVTGAPYAQEKGDEKAPDAPAGVWKVSVPFAGEDGGQPRWLLKLEQKGGKWSGEVVAVAQGWSKTELEKLSVSEGMLRFHLKSSTLTLTCEVKLPRDGKASKLYGVATLRKRATPMELERTTLTSLEPIEQLREMFAKQALGHEAIQLSLRLLSQSEKLKAKPAEVRSWAEKAVKSADLYGPAFQRDVLLMVAQVLTEEQKGFEAIGLQYARRAERLLEPKESAVAQKRVLDVLAGVLEKAGKEKDVTEVQQRLAKLDFRIKVKPYPGRKAKSDRVVLVELFTGAECLPCVAADLAFDAVGKTYKPSEVVLLQYHIHTPGPDALTCPDSEARASFYEDAIRGIPTALFNGRPAAGGGGSRDDALEKYEDYVEVVDRLLEEPAKAALKVAATRKDGKISITAEVEKLGVTGDDVRLRVVLIEEAVAYKGGNGMATHRHVVRAMPGGADGVVLNEKSAKKTFTVDVEDLRKKQKAYLDKVHERRPFPNKERPIELKKLKVVALIQNDKGGEVIQAAQADVPEELAK
jgi:hypothetical protein